MFLQQQNCLISFLENDLRHLSDGVIVGASACLEVQECIVKCLTIVNCCHIIVHPTADFFLVEFVAMESCDKVERVVYRDLQGR